MKIPVLWRASLRHLLRHPWLIGLSMVGVAVAVAVVVGIDLANAGARRGFELSVEAVAGRATHELTAGPGGLDERLYARLRAELGVRESAPIVEATVAGVGDGRIFQLLGIDLFTDQAVRSFTPTFSPSQAGEGARGGDPVAFLTRSGSAYLGAELAAELELAIGDRLAVRAAGDIRELTVVGLLEPADDLGRQALADLLVVDVASAQELLGLDGRLSRIDLKLTPEAAADLERRLPPGVELTPKSARSGALEQMTRAFRLNLTALGLLALVVGMFLIYNTMTFSVVQRRRLLGSLRTLGVTRGQIFGLVVAEAAAVGLLGSGLGLGLGILLAEGLQGLVVRTINDLYFVLSVRSVELAPASLAKGLALGAGGAVLAALRPAREATAVAPRAALQRSSLERDARAAVRRGGVIGGALLLLALGLLLLPTQSLPVSFGALFVFVLGAAALVPPAMVHAMRLARAPMRRIFGVLGTMATRGVTAALSRTGVAAAALVVAVSVTLGVGAMVASFRSTLIGWLDVTLQADVYVAPAEPGSRGGATELDPRVLAAVEGAPGVDFVTTYRRVRVSSSLGPVELGALRTQRPAFAAFDFARGEPDEAWRRFQEGAVIVSEPLAYHHGLDVGSRLTLATGRGQQTFEVAGVYYDYGSDRGVVTLSRQTYDRFWDDPAIFSIGVFTGDGVDRRKLIDELRGSFPDGVQACLIANRDLHQASLAVFDRTFVITGVLRLLAMIVAFIGVLAALMALQLERRRELGVLRAGGLTPRQVWGLVTAQCGLLGMVSGLLALPLGAALAALLIHVINKRSFGWTLSMELPPGVFVQAVLLAFASALLAGIYPAYKLSKSPPALALRSE